MSCPIRRLALAVALIASPDRLFGQGAEPDSPIVLAPMHTFERFVVARVDPTGTVHLRPSGKPGPAAEDTLGGPIVRGNYVLVTNAVKAPAKTHVFWVRVTAVEPDQLVTIDTGGAAAKQVLQQEECSLLARRPDDTLARMPGRPVEIPLPRARPVPGTEPDPREAALLKESTNHLMLIGLALNNYMAATGRVPPAVIFGPDGKPWHSWRVLVLPYLEQVELYSAYDFDQPWDSPKNTALLSRMPDVFRDPIHGPSREPFTHYAALVGPSAVFRPDGPKQAGAVPRDTGGTRVVDIIDGVDSTLAVSCVEPARKIPWTKPEDIDVGPGFKGFGKPGGIAAPYRTAGQPDVRCAPFLLAGGFTKTIATSIEPAQLLALMTRAGGEAVRFADMPAVFSPVGRPKRLTIVIDGGKLKASIE